MRMRQRSRGRDTVCLASLALGCLLGCGGGSTGPSTVEGTYRLVELNGQVLPYDHVIGCCIYTDGSLLLRSEGYEASITFRNKNTQSVFTVGERGTYSVSGESIAFGPISGDNLPLSLYGGQVDGRSIRVMLGGDGPGAADQFRALFTR